ncbi:Kinase [Giardia lamblia P15]|uniref:Kinase n=1 Tax=Giardia intestinalis (strain P15) TaxID=658858 RepID=E1EYE0_GIAIA|nr:Kinase [Giardia lamblia P15]
MTLHEMNHASTDSTSSTSETETATGVFHLLTGISAPFLPGLLRVPVKDRIWVTTTAQGNVCINEWIIQRTIGRGAYANVRLCHNPLTEQKAAMRMINRTSLRRKLLTQESADKFLWNCSRVMDFLTTAHPSILNLIEVMHHPTYADVCSVENSMESLVPGSVFAGQYAVTPGSLPPWVQAILSIAQQVNLICELPSKYQSIADQLSNAKGMLQPELASDLQLLLHNPMALNGIVKPLTQGSELAHRRMPSAGSKLKQYSARSSQLDSNLTPRYQNTGRCTMNYDDNFVFIIEYCDGGTLQEVVRTADLKKIMILFYQVVDALCYMHFCNIVHQDIKLENIIITTDLQNTFKTPIPPASKLLPRKVPRTTDLFFTSTSGAMSDFTVGTIQSQSSTPLASTALSSDPSHSNPIENTLRRDPKDRYNIPPLSLKLPLQNTISTAANPPAAMPRGPTRISSRLNDNVLSPLLLPSGSRYRLQSLKESSDITYYLLGDSDTAPYRAKISDFDTAIILEEEGVRLPTAQTVLETLKSIYDRHLSLLYRSFTYLFDDLVRQRILPQEDEDSLLSGHDLVTSMNSDCVHVLSKRETDLVSSTFSFNADMLGKEGTTICTEATKLDDSQRSLRPSQMDIDTLNGSIGIYRMSGIYETQSLDVSEPIFDKVGIKPSNPSCKDTTLKLQQATVNVIKSDTNIRTERTTCFDEESSVTRALQSSCLTLILSLDNQKNSFLDNLEPCPNMPLPDDDLHVATSQKSFHTDALNLKLIDLTPDGTGLVEKTCKGHTHLDADVPADNSLMVPAIDCSIKTSASSLPHRDTALLSTISRIEDFIQGAIETSKAGQALQSYLLSIRQINTFPAMPKNTYFISNSTGTPTILSPESRAVIQTCSDHNPHRAHPLFSAVHADAWQTGVMLFHSLTGLVRRTPLYRYSQEAFALCGTFGMLITDLLCGLLDEISSHRYTLFECMYHPAVNPRQFKLPMSIPAKGTSDVSVTTIHSILSHAHSVAASKSGNIRTLWREARTDYYQLRRFHMLIIMRRRQYVLANNKMCIAASTIDNSMIYTCTDIPLLINTLGLFSSRLSRKSKCDIIKHTCHHVDDFTTGEKINTHAHIIASEKLKTKTELCSKNRAKSPMSSSDVLNKHMSFSFESEGCTDTDLLSDTESNTSVYVTVPEIAQVHVTGKSTGICMIDRIFEHHNTVSKASMPFHTNKVRHNSVSLMDEARHIKTLLERVLSKSLHDGSPNSLLYRFPSPVLNERTRNKQLLSIINSSRFIAEASSGTSLYPRRRHIFNYIKKLLKNYQRSLTREQVPISSTSSLKVSLSAPDLRVSSLNNNSTTHFEHPLLDAYASMRQEYGVSGNNSQGPESSALDSILSDSFENVLHTLVDEKNILHVHNFDWSEKISPLDVYIGSSQNAVEFSLRLLRGNAHDTNSFFDLDDQETLSTVKKCTTLKSIITKLKRMQLQNVIDGLTTLTVGSSFYELGTRLWYQMLTRSFSEALGNERDVEYYLKDDINSFQPGSLFPVAEVQSQPHKLQHSDISAQSASSSSTESLESSRASSPFNQLTADFSEHKSSASVPTKVLSNLPLSTRTLSGIKLDIQEISEIEHISMTSTPIADHSQVKPKAFSQKTSARSLPGNAFQLSTLAASHSCVLSPTRNNKSTPNQSPRQQQFHAEPEPSSPVIREIDAKEISISSAMSQKSVDFSSSIRPEREQAVAGEQLEKPLDSALNDKYVQRNKLYNRTAISKIFAGMEGQQKQASLKERESSAENGNPDSFRDMGVEPRFVHRDKIFTRSLEDCIVASQIRKELKDVGGLTSIFDDSICTTIDDDNVDDEPRGEHSIMSRNNSFHYELHNDDDQQNVSDIMLMRNKRQTRTTGSFSKLRTTSTVTNNNTIMPSQQQQQQVYPPTLSTYHYSADEPTNSVQESLVGSTPEYKCSYPPPTTFPDIGHGTSQYMCCCCKCTRPEADIQDFNLCRIQLLTTHYRFLYRYGCHISWDPCTFNKGESSFPRGLFLRRLRTLLIGRINLPLHWINASIQYELTRWNDFTMKGESSTSTGTPAVSDAKPQLRPTSPRSPLVIPTLDLQSLPKESAGIKTPITRIRLVNQDNDTTDFQSENTSARPIIPKLCFLGNNTDSRPTNLDNSIAGSDTSPSSASLHVESRKKPSTTRIDTDVIEAEDPASISDASSTYNTSGIAQSAPLANLLAIQSTVPSTMHVNRASSITSDNTSIGQCSTDSSDI